MFKCPTSVKSDLQVGVLSHLQIKTAKNHMNIAFCNSWFLTMHERVLTSVCFKIWQISIGWPHPTDVVSCHLCLFLPGVWPSRGTPIYEHTPMHTNSYTLNRPLPVFRGPWEVKTNAFKQLLVVWIHALCGMGSCSKDVQKVSLFHKPPV